MKCFSIPEFLFLPLFSGITLSAFPQQHSLPNLVIVFPDQMRGQAMGFSGIEKVKTPVLDQFAKQSVNFTNAICNYPLSSPTRGMLMTGMYPTKSGLITNCTNISATVGCEVSSTAVCWSDILKAKGYSLGYIGK